MLARDVVEEFLDCQFEDMELEIPLDISKNALVEAFCQYVEDDYYEWVKDNFESFFNHSNPDWEWIRERMKSHNILS
jgi:hypothetical protein